MNKTIYSVRVVELKMFLYSNGLDKIERYGPHFATSDINKAHQLAEKKRKTCPDYSYVVEERS